MGPQAEHMRMQTGVEFERAILAPQGLSSQILVQQIINLYQLSLHSGKFTNRRWCCSISPLETLSGLLLSIQYLVVFWPWKSKKRPQQKAESSHFRLPTSVANRSFVSFPRSKDGKFDDYHYLGKFSQKGGKFDDYHYGRYNSPRRMASLMITIM